MPDNPAVLPVEGEESEPVMAESLVDASIQSGALSNLATEQAAAAARRIGRFDQLAADSAAMWTVALTTPTVMAGMGFRVAQQSEGYPAKGGTGTGT